MIITERHRVHVQNREGHGYSDKRDYLKYWKDQTGQTPKKCANLECDGKAECGGHVYKYHSGSNPHYYIVPLCNSCNHKDFPTGCYVYEDDLVDAPKQD